MINSVKSGTEQRLTLSTVVEANIRDIWQEILKTSSLKYITSPILSFSPLFGKDFNIWNEGKIYFFKLKLFGFIPLGTHRAIIPFIDRFQHSIYTSEANDFIKNWKHQLSLEKVDENHTKYTDIIDFDAGIFTPLMMPISKIFFMHRHRKLKRLFNAQAQEAELAGEIQ